MTPLLANAYAATGAGPWCLTGSSQTQRRARYRLCRWLVQVAGLPPCGAARLIGLVHPTVFRALRTPEKPACEPSVSFQRAMVGVEAPIWVRNPFGALPLRYAATRRLVWARMLADGLSSIEVGAACGCAASAVRDACGRHAWVLHKLGTTPLENRSPI